MTQAKRIKRESASIAIGVGIPGMLLVLAETGALDPQSAVPAVAGSALVGVAGLATWGMFRLAQIRAYATDQPQKGTL